MAICSAGSVSAVSLTLPRVTPPPERSWKVHRLTDMSWVKVRVTKVRGRARVRVGVRVRVTVRVSVRMEGCCTREG